MLKKMLRFGMLSILMFIGLFGLMTPTLMQVVSLLIGVGLAAFVFKGIWRWLRKGAIALSVGLPLFFLLAALGSYLADYYEGLKPQPIVSHADGIIVLTGGRGRVAQGFELLQQNKAPTLFITGVQSGVEKAELLHQQKTSHDHNSVVIGHVATNTRENALEALSWINEHHLKHILLVTSHYHMPRSLEIFHAYAPHLKISPAHVLPQDYTPNDELSLLEPRMIFLKEYPKYVLIRVWYRIRPVREFLLSLWGRQSFFHQ